MSYRDHIDWFLRRAGIRIENRPPSDERAHPRGPVSNARSLGEVPPDESGSWNIDWNSYNADGSPADSLRRAILGLGPKRPTVAPKRPPPPKDYRAVWSFEKNDWVIPWIDPNSR
jgi:hypothetical protein